jgi:transcriptional regulator with XRE-family HTH domain
MPRKIPPPQGATLRFFRFSHGSSAEELAQAAGLSSPSLISEYENGSKSLSRERLEELLAPLDVPPEAIDAALFSLELAGREAPASLATLSEEDRRGIGRAAARFGAKAAKAFRAELIATIRASRVEEERRRAAEVWDVLRQLTPRERKTVVDVAGEHLGWAVCERLCEESEKAGADKAERAAELAGLALRVAERTPGPESSHLQGYAWAFMGNAHRIQGNLPGADEAFLRSARFWQEGEAAGPVPLDRTRLLDLEASLRKYQGRFEEALALLDQALARTENARSKVRLLIKQATTLELQGAYQEAVEGLGKAISLLEESSEPRLHLGVRFNLAVNLLHLGRHDEAAALLPKVRTFAIELGNELDFVRILWLEGRIAKGFGRHEEALTLLSQVQGELSSRAIAYDSALVSLEVAILYLEKSRTGEVKRLAHQILWILSAQSVRREALAALRLFCQAAELETATPNLVQHILSYLEVSRHAPEIPFKEGRTGA